MTAIENCDLPTSRSNLGYLPAWNDNHRKTNIINILMVFNCLK